MSFLNFFLLIVGVYVFYYIVTIITDLIKIKAVSQAVPDGSIQYDFGAEEAPQDAVLNVTESNQGGKKQSTDIIEQSIGEELNDKDQTISSIDLSLENNLSNEQNAAEEYININSKRRAAEHKQ